jgi:hypothetical protein
MSMDWWRGIVDSMRDRVDDARDRMGDRRDRIFDAIGDRKDAAFDRIGDRRNRIGNGFAGRVADRTAGAWASIDDRFPHAHRIIGWSAPLIAVVGMIAVGPAVMSAVSGPTDGGASRSATQAAPAEPSVDSGESGSTSTTSTSTAESTTTVAPTPVETIELVPPLRDVVVEVDRVEFVSDANGTIAVPASLRGGSFSFIGVREQPPLRQVTFDRWADGTGSDRRSLAEVSGPVARIGVVEQRRITVWSSLATPAGTQVHLESQAGPLNLPVGTTTWVDAVRADDTDGALVTEELTYTADEIVVDGTVSPISPQTFSPTPEALWVVAVEPAPEPTPGQP